MTERTALFTHAEGVYFPANKNAVAVAAALSRRVLDEGHMFLVRTHGFTPAPDKRNGDRKGRGRSMSHWGRVNQLIRWKRLASEFVQKLSKHGDFNPSPARPNLDHENYDFMRALEKFVEKWKAAKEQA